MSLRSAMGTSAVPARHQASGFCEDGRLVVAAAHGSPCYRMRPAHHTTRPGPSWTRPTAACGRGAEAEIAGARRASEFLRRQLHARRHGAIGALGATTRIAVRQVALCQLCRLYCSLCSSLDRAPTVLTPGSLRRPYSCCTDVCRSSLRQVCFYTALTLGCSCWCRCFRVVASDPARFSREFAMRYLLAYRAAPRALPLGIAHLSQSALTWGFPHLKTPRVLGCLRQMHPAPSATQHA